MISAWWLLLVIPAFSVGSLFGYAYAYIVNAIKAGARFFDALHRAFEEMERDAGFAQKNL